MLRKAEARDIPLIGEIHAASWKTAYAGIVPESYLNSLTGDQWTGPLKQWLASGALSIWLLEEGDRVLGCVSFGRGREDGKKNWGEIVSLYLFPEYFAQGKGAALMEQALNTLREDGFSAVYLWVLEENERARRFYEKQGFCANGDTLEMELAAKKLTEVRYVANLV